MGWHSDLLTGMAAHLAAGGAGTWRSNGSAYTAGETAIVLTKMPPSPDKVICLSTYTVESTGYGDLDVTVGVQVRTRAGRDPREVLDLSDAVFELLDGARQLQFGAVWVSQIFRRSGEELSALPKVDKQADRNERVDNYYVQASRSTPNRTP